MAKKQAKAAKKAPVQEVKEEISQELQDKVKALKQIINCHDLLNQGQFSGFHNKRIGEGLEFLAALHKQMMDDVQADPQAHLIPELLQDKGE